MIFWHSNFYFFVKNGSTSGDLNFIVPLCYSLFRLILYINILQSTRLQILIKIDCYANFGKTFNQVKINLAGIFFLQKITLCNVFPCL